MSAQLFFSEIRKSPFGGSLSQTAVDSVNAIIAAFHQYGDDDNRKLAYILATAFHESDRFKTMREYASGAAYEGRKDLGNTQKGDGRKYAGRGFVQLTGRRNYADWSNRLGLDLLSNPDLVMDRTIAARILVEGMMRGTFTGKGLSSYIDASKTDFANARRTVNGTDRAALIAGYAKSFLKALEVSDILGAETTPVIIAPTPEPEETKMPEPNTSTPTPVEQASKTVGAAKGSAQGSVLAGAIITLLLAFGVLPPELNTAEVGAAIGVVLTAISSGVLAAIQAYRAPPNAG